MKTRILMNSNCSSDSVLGLYPDGIKELGSKEPLGFAWKQLQGCVCRLHWSLWLKPSKE